MSCIPRLFIHKRLGSDSQVRHESVDKLVLFPHLIAYKSVLLFFRFNTLVHCLCRLKSSDELRLAIRKSVTERIRFFILGGVPRIYHLLRLLVAVLEGRRGLRFSLQDVCPGPGAQRQRLPPARHAGVHGDEVGVGEAVEADAGDLGSSLPPVLEDGVQSVHVFGNVNPYNGCAMQNYQPKIIDAVGHTPFSKG